MISQALQEAPWLTCTRVRASLTAVESEMLAAIRGSGPLVDEVCGHVVRAGGKRLRPALVLLAAEFGDPTRPHVLTMAVAVELLHAATLYHDDIVDETAARRGRPSANARWGSLVAAYAGAYLLSRAMELFAAGGDEADELVSDSVARVWKGQMEELESVDTLDLDEGRLLGVIERKTAALFELPCRLGALAAGAPAAATAALAEFGGALGMAFQLVDDVMDIAAGEPLLGKPPGTDLREGVYTLPVLRALQSGGEDGQRLRSILARRDMRGGDLDEALALLRRSGALARTLEVAGGYVTRAECAAHRLPDGDANESLLRLAATVRHRAGEV
jgi:heptaprenyl diphosphate synthase